MKHGSEYAKHVKRLYRQMLREHGKPEVPAPTDPMEQLVLSILYACTSDLKGAAVYRRLREQMVDLNELRVTPAMELAEMIGSGMPLAAEKARRIVDALNAVRRRQDKLDLSFLHQRGRREARELLESLAGVDRATAAWTVLLSLGGHAVPVDEMVMHVLRQEGAIDPEATVAEVQAFLERTIPAEETAVFSILLQRYAAAKTSRLPPERFRHLLAPPAPAAPPPVVAPALPVHAEKPVPAKVANPAEAAAGGKNGKPEKHDKAEAKPVAKPAPAKPAPLPKAAATVVKKPAGAQPAEPPAKPKKK